MGQRDLFPKGPNRNVCQCHCKLNCLVFLPQTPPQQPPPNLMARTKRAAEDGPDDGPATRAAKVAKTDKTSPASKAKKGGAKKAKVAIPTSEFKSKALPLHVNLTHTPPVLSNATDTVQAAPTDPGHLGSLTLVPKSFKTGSYGWTGTKRLAIELLNPDGGDKEKVNVMLTINATVMGSKDADGEKEEEKAEEKEEEKDEEAAAEEDAAAED
ncbi:hypothetical protein B0H12DRAFT_162491 [Mycena haematopus]|nr:hypothetical protein B0H12DRAFT_162491 [Mycena haematopus]